jgi:hypothetical protein
MLRRSHSQRCIQHGNRNQEFQRERDQIRGHPSSSCLKKKQRGIQQMKKPAAVAGAGCMIFAMMSVCR